MDTLNLQLVLRADATEVVDAGSRSAMAVEGVGEAADRAAGSVARLTADLGTIGPAAAVSAGAAVAAGERLRAALAADDAALRPAGGNAGVQARVDRTTGTTRDEVPGAQVTAALLSREMDAAERSAEAVRRRNDPSRAPILALEEEAREVERLTRLQVLSADEAATANARIAASYRAIIDEVERLTTARAAASAAGATAPVPTFQARIDRAVGVGATAGIGQANVDAMERALLAAEQRAEEVRRRTDPGRAQIRALEEERAEIVRLRDLQVLSADDAEAALGRVAAAQSRVTAEIERAQAATQAAQAAEARRAVQMTGLTPAAAASEGRRITAPSFARLGDYSAIPQQATQAARATKEVSYEIRNLLYQANDAATMLAAGASPFMVLATQGGQVAQVLAGGGGALSGMTLVKAAIASLATPTAAWVAGIAAAGVAIYALDAASTRWTEKMKSQTEEQITLLDRLKARYGDVAVIAGKAITRPAELDRFEAERSVERAPDLQRRAAVEFGRLADPSGPLAWSAGMGQVRPLLEAARREIDAGTFSAGKFEIALSEIGRANIGNEHVQRLVDHLMEMAAPLVDAEIATGQLRAGLEATTADAARLRAEAQEFERLLAAGLYTEAARGATSMGQALRAAAAEQRHLREEAGRFAAERLAGAGTGYEQRNEEIQRERAGLPPASGDEARQAAQETIRDRLAELEVIRAGIGLVGASEQARRRETAALEADQEIRRRGLDIAGQEAEQIRDLTLARAEEQARLEQATRAREEADRLADQRRVRAAANAAIAAGASPATAERTAQIDLAVAPLQRQVDGATGEERTRLAADLAARRAALTELADLERRSAALGEISAGEDRLTIARAELAVVGQSEAARARVLALVQAELRIRQLGLDAAGAEAEQLRRVAAEQAALEAAKRRAEAIDREIEQSGEAVIDGLGAAIANFDGSWRSMGDTALGVLRELYAELVKLALLNPLKNWAFGAGLPTLSDVVGRVAGGTSPAAASAAGIATKETATGAATAVATGAVFQGDLSTPGGMFRYLRGQGLNDAQAAGLLGNMRQESSLNPLAYNEREGAFGMMQWRGSRLEDLKRFSAARGLDYQSREAQLAFAPYEARTSELRSARQFLGAEDLPTANAGLKKFIRYGDQSISTREAYGQQYLAAYGGQIPAGGADGVAAAASQAAPALREVAGAAKGAGTGLLDVAKAAAGGVTPQAGATGAAVAAVKPGQAAPTAAAGGLDLSWLDDMMSSITKGIGDALKGLMSGLGSIFKSIFAALFHGGGVVGGGTGGTGRTVSAAVIAGAGRLHAGGMAAALAAGLAAGGSPALARDEVPAVLLRNEAVLTTTQQAAIKGALARAGVADVPGLPGDLRTALVPSPADARGATAGGAVSAARRMLARAADGRPRYHDGGVVGGAPTVVAALGGGVRTSIAMPTAGAMRLEITDGRTQAPAAAPGGYDRVNISYPGGAKGDVETRERMVGQERVLDVLVRQVEQQMVPKYGLTRVRRTR